MIAIDAVVAIDADAAIEAAIEIDVVAIDAAASAFDTVVKAVAVASYATASKHQLAACILEAGYTSSLLVEVCLRTLAAFCLLAVVPADIELAGVNSWMVEQWLVPLQAFRALHLAVDLQLHLHSVPAADLTCMNNSCSNNLDPFLHTNCLTTTVSSMKIYFLFLFFV